MAQVVSDTNDESTPLMPIHARYRWFYPIDWPQLSAVIRFRRAQGKCEGCGRPHGRVVCHLGDGRWWDREKKQWRDGRGRPLRQLPALWLWRTELPGPSSTGCSSGKAIATRCPHRSAATEKGHHLERQLNPSPGRSPAGAPARDDASGLGKDPRPFAGEAHL